MSAVDDFRPRNVKAPHGASELSITWADGTTSSYPHEILRGFCPCATCQGHSGKIVFVAGGSVDLREIEQVGNYAFGLTWADGHSSGIYSFRFLRTRGNLIAEKGAEGLRALGELPRT